MSDADFIREVEELYLRLANADTDDLVELAKLAGLDPKTVIEEKQMIEIEMVQIPDASFAIGKYPITQAQYESVMGTNPSYFINNLQNPVENLCWYDARSFCQKLSQITGKLYRLPSNTEWEYACRAGTTTRFYFGNDFNQLGDYAWYYDNSQKTTHPVGQKLPNDWGLYDMSGNVWEMTQEAKLRGGSWYSDPTYCYSAYICNLTLAESIGFRVVCDN